MSSKKEIVNEYRKSKKMNQLKMKDKRMNRHVDFNDDNILNTLPSGVFEKKVSFSKEILEDNKFINELPEKDLLQTNKIEEKNNILLEEDNEDDEDQEKFTEDYFEPVVYNPTKK